MRLLIITDATTKAVATIKAEAIRNRIPLDEMKRLFVAKAITGDIPAYDKQRLEIPIGYRVFYTVEEQPKTGWTHHISISLDAPNKWPAIAAVSAIIGCFGFDPDLEKQIMVYPEEHPEEQVNAINVIGKLPEADLKAIAALDIARSPALPTPPDESPAH